MFLGKTTTLYNFKVRVLGGKKFELPRLWGVMKVVVDMTLT